MSLQTAAIKAVGMCVSTGLMGIILWKMMRYLDPHYETNENAKRKLEELKRILNLDPKLELNSHEIRLATQIVLPEEGVDLEDIGGCSDILRQVEDNVLMPLLLKTSNIRLPSAYYNPPMGILLHGPPGCGKTLIARAIAKSAGAFFINFDIASFSDMWYGETSKLTKALFTLSQKIQPCIIFIDEIDSILRSRSNHDHEATAIMKTQFMSLWDGFLNSEKTVIIIGATNRPSDVDDAILRRLPFRIHVPKPDAASRAQIIKVLMKKENKCPDFDYCKVADSTASLSGSDLKEVVRIACLTKYSEAVQHILSNGTADNPPTQQICSVQISHDDLIMAAQTFNKNSKDLNVNKGAFLMDMLKLD